MTQMKNLLLKKRILIVDDEDLLREILSEDLTSAGATVIEAANGEIAFDLLKKHSFDAVVTDIRMPGGNGTDLIKNINTYFQNEKPKIFVCSGYNDFSLKEVESVKVSFTFNKPFDRDTFIRTIALFLQTTSTTTKLESI